MPAAGCRDHSSPIFKFRTFLLELIRGAQLPVFTIVHILCLFTDKLLPKNTGKSVMRSSKFRQTSIEKNTLFIAMVTVATCFDKKGLNLQVGNYRLLCCSWHWPQMWTISTKWCQNWVLPLNLTAQILELKGFFYQKLFLTGLSRA